MRMDGVQLFDFRSKTWHCLKAYSFITVEERSDTEPEAVLNTSSDLATEVKEKFEGKDLCYLF